MKVNWKRLLVGGLAAVILAAIPTSAYADGFYNCIDIWWITNCYWVDLDLMNADVNSVGFEAMYALCQWLGLCP